MPDLYSVLRTALEVQVRVQRGKRRGGNEVYIQSHHVPVSCSADYVPNSTGMLHARAPESTNVRKYCDSTVLFMRLQFTSLRWHGNCVALTMSDIPHLIYSSNWLPCRKTITAHHTSSTDVRDR